MSDLEYSVAERIATIRLNRPEKMNAFTPEMLRDWRKALLQAKDDDAVRVIVLTGAGKAFCAGGDLSGKAAEADRAAIIHKENLRRGPQGVTLAMQDVEKPLIAAVNGAAVGAGMDMALMCDIRMMARSARFSEAYLKVGLVPGAGGCYFLPRIVGVAKALELFMTGDFVGSDEAERIGLVNHVFDDDQLMQETYAFAKRLADMPPIALSMIKRTIYQSLHCDLRTSLDLISSHMGIVRVTEDSKEAMAAFKEKRVGIFHGC